MEKTGTIFCKGEAPFFDVPAHGFCERAFAMVSRMLQNGIAYTGHGQVRQVGKGIEDAPGDIGHSKSF